MPTLPIPLFSRSYKSADGTVLTDDSFLQYNGFLDQLQGLNVRPGETLAKNSAARNDGLFYWPDKNYIVSVDNGVVSLNTISGDTLTTAFATGNVTFGAGSIVTFASDGSKVFLAGGGKINYVDSSGIVTELADPDAPARVTHVAFIDGYILAVNEPIGGDGKFYWSDIPTDTDWSALSFATAEGSPDNTNGVYVVQRQIYLLGTVSTEIWENDGSTPFSRIPGGLIEVGCAARHSPIVRGNSLMWLSHTRQFVEFTGIDVKFISSRYDDEIAQFETISDCIGGYILKDGQEFCVFHFPTEQRTLAYNPNADDWSEWANWNDTTMRWEAYDFRSTARDIVSGKTFVGKKNAQVIACLTKDKRTDLLSSSTTRPFKFLRVTGFIDNGTSKKKRLEELRFRAKRGAKFITSPQRIPKLMFRYRNNGRGEWSNLVELSLGAVGQTVHHVKLKRLGIFESRQFEISATDDVPVVLSNAEVDVTVLR